MAPSPTPTPLPAHAPSSAGDGPPAGDGAAPSSLRPASPGHAGDARAPAAPARGGNGGSSAALSPSNAAAAQQRHAAGETAAASSLRRPPSAGRLASFASDPSLSTSASSSLPRKQQQQQQPPAYNAAWGAQTGAFSAGVTPTAASASASAAALSASTFGGGAAGRSWLKVDAEGRAAVVRVDKAHLAAELGVQARDLRLLDPHFNHSYPSAILCRDRALVVNLEHIKLIITPTQVLVLNAADAAVRAFVDELCRRLEAAPSRPFNGGAKGEAEGGKDAGGVGGGKKGGDGTTDRPLSAPNGGTAAPAAAGTAPNADGDASKEPSEKPFSETPFELRALEVALETVCAHLEAAAGDLEAAAHPALDDLTAAVTTPNLERVRRVKTRLVRLTTRVETLREVLEKILDDDSDMHDMNLTARALDAIERAQQQQLQLAQQQAQQALQQQHSGLVGPSAADQQQQQQQQQQQFPLASVEEAPQAEEARDEASVGGAAAAPAAVATTAADAAAPQEQPSSPFSAEQQQQLLLQRSSSQAAAAVAAAAVAPAALVEALEEERERDDTEIAQVEQVLEPYFMQVDNTFNRLQTLCEYIDDTEDYINIELDNHRNQLIRLELMLTAATFAVSLVGAISGIFGMNLVNGNEDSHAVFVATSVGSSLGAVAVFCLIFAVCKKRGLI